MAYLPLISRIILTPPVLSAKQSAQLHSGHQKAGSPGRQRDKNM